MILGNHLRSSLKKFENVFPFYHSHVRSFLALSTQPFGVNGHRMNPAVKLAAEE